MGCLVCYLAAGALAGVAADVATADVAVAAAAEQNCQNDDPPNTAATEAIAVTHNRYLRNFRFEHWAHSMVFRRRKKVQAYSMQMRIGYCEVIKMGENQMQLPHRLTLNERRQLSMTGVTEVVSFDENTVVLHTDLGALVIQGQGLQLKTLSPDGGQVMVEGSVSSMNYQEPRLGGSWLRRLMG